MSLYRQLLRKTPAAQTLKPILRSISTAADSTSTAVQSHHNDHQRNHEFRPPSDYLNSWTAPKDPKEAEAKLARLRREYAKKVKEVRKEYIQEMELQRIEKMRKDEAKKEAQRIANEERKVAKAAEKKAKAKEREAAEEEFRKTLMIIAISEESMQVLEVLVSWFRMTTNTLKASHISLLPYGPPNHCWDNPPSALVCTATAFIVPAFYSLTCPLWHGPVCAPEADKLPRQKSELSPHLIQLKERQEKLEYWRMREKNFSKKKKEKNDLLQRQSSMWIDEKELEKKTLEAIVDTVHL
ncbi:hypothetical protein MTR67_024771 [Solanum verrucosum]|uniref:Uncharacterized protein n=1 Tax=Solanum verrucosum TaxID=315347 RepID=A0AAF0TSZ9_SOLVR|nr:hypothetical protein MTR67_024771 [Solanum verrucosum]